MCLLNCGICEMCLFCGMLIIIDMLYAYLQALVPPMPMCVECKQGFQLGVNGQCSKVPGMLSHIQGVEISGSCIHVLESIQT